MLVTELLTQNAQQHPTKTAVLTNESSILYGELEDAVTRLSRHLIGRGLRSGERVALHWHNSVEYVIVMLSVWRAGLILVSINPRLKTAEIAWVLEHSGAQLCFSDPELLKLVPAGVEVLSQLPATATSTSPLLQPDLDAPLMILYTSGTTARPKGVVHTARTLLEGATMVLRYTPGSGDRPLAISQMAHIGALQTVFLPALLQCGTVVLLRAFDAAGALDIIERFRCTYFFTLPASLQFMAEEQAERPRDVSSLRSILAGGDSCSLALHRRVKQQLEIHPQEGCGMTEVTPVAINPPDAVRPGSIGLAVNGEVRVVDSRGIEVASGDVGEMVIRSPANCLGYWNDPQATAQLFEGGWLHTGDLVTRDPEGYLWFRGRLKQVIMRGGSNISPQEVEEALYQHPAVLEAGVVGFPDTTWGEVPVAFVALRAQSDVTADQLTAHARMLLADYKVPTRFFLLGELPKGPTGKIDRRCLRESLVSETNNGGNAMRALA